jgi:glycerol-3-phosphate dehydrogenase (NAD(P)+)
MPKTISEKPVEVATEMAKQQNVLIIGYGEMGHAMQSLLNERHHLSIYDSRPVEGLTPIDIEQEAASADFILFCIPTQPLEAMLKRVSPRFQEHAICLSISKGLDELGRTPAQVYEQTLHTGQRYSLLYGPMISEEIRADRYGFAELGCSDATVYDRIKALYRGSALAIRESDDITGISWSVILKNIYAIAFGAADELELGDNVRGFLAVTAMEELGSIVEVMGGNAATPLKLAGLGDLITTATSKDSHHHELGSKLARGETEGISGEGIHTLEMVEKYKLFDTSSYPLFSLVHTVVQNPADTEQKFGSYLRSIQ